MPTEADLRDLLHGDGAEPGALDTTRIIRKARARRRPRQLVAGIGGGVAAAGALAFVLPAALGLGGGGLSMAGGSAADDAATGDDASILKEDGAAGTSASLAASAELLNTCGAPVAEPAPDTWGMGLVVAPVDAVAGGETIETDVTLTNTGETTITTNSPMYLTFAGDGTVLWHGEGSVDVVRFELDPGASARIPVTFEPVSCTAPGEAVAEPGSYEVSAAVDVITADGTARVATGPATTITLR